MKPWNLVSSSHRSWQWDDFQRPAHKEQPSTHWADSGPLRQPREVERHVPVPRGSHQPDEPACGAPRGGPGLQAAGQRLQQQQLQLPHLPGPQQLFRHQGKCLWTHVCCLCVREGLIGEWLNKNIHTFVNLHRQQQTWRLRPRLWKWTSYFPLIEQSNIM